VADPTKLPGLAMPFTSAMRAVPPYAGAMLMRPYRGSDPSKLGKIWVSFRSTNHKEVIQVDTYEWYGLDNVPWEKVSSFFADPLPVLGAVSAYGAGNYGIPQSDTLGSYQAIKERMQSSSSK